MYYITPVSVGLVWVDALVHTMVFAGLGVLLWHILLYGKYETLLPVQQIINYTALAILTISLWLGIGFLLNYLILNEIAILFIPTMPVRGMIGLLLYLILILSARQKNDPDSDHESVPSETEISINVKPEIIERITVRMGQKLHLIPIQEIIYIQSDGDYVQVITHEGKYLKEQTMKFFEINLPQKSFVRIHRSYIVNIEHIVRIESYGRQNQQIALKNGHRLKVSISGYKLLKEALVL
jgi:DNA-binding LytR/AlgR family response regulator